METWAKTSLILLLFALTPYLVLSWGLGKEQLARRMFWVFFISPMMGWGYLWSAANYLSWQTIITCFLVWHGLVSLPVVVIIKIIRVFHWYFCQESEGPPPSPILMF